ncbi:SpoIIE family protein phosphatase [Simkania negevensis]|uniref:SpoIIE family protein phosphatase n=1 Tax=Simkania negevensis TaxID=83561 RepID=A0ABS3APW2_9BACT|nr:SpoIIE family protein phosphatase [Simkania negevensis]
MSRQGSIAQRVLLVCVIFLALPLVIYFVTVFRINYDREVKEIFFHLQEMGLRRAMVVEQQSRSIYTSLGVIEDFFDFDGVGNGLDENLNRKMKKTTREEGLSALFYLKRVGNKFICVASSDETLLGKDYTEVDFVHAAIQARKLEQLGYDPVQQEWESIVALAIEGREGKIGGLLVAEKSADQLVSLAVEEERMLYGIAASLVDQQDKIVASSEERLIGEEIASLKMRLVSGGEGIWEFDLLGKKQIGVRVPVVRLGVSLFFNVDVTSVFEKQKKILILELVAFAVVLVVAIAVTLFITRRLSRPFRRLCTTMEQIKQGNLSVKYLRDLFGFEINTLGLACNEMVDAIVKNMKEAEAQRVQKEAFEQELRIGRDIQQAILPQQMPQIEGVDLAAYYSPAKEVGGDFYDVFVCEEEEKIVLTVADASGKGISACLYSLGLRSTLRSLFASKYSLDEALVQANELFSQDTGDTGMFVTALVGVYNKKTGLLSYLSCGHNPGILRKANGTVLELAGGGIAMGVVPYGNLPIHEVVLEKGDAVLFYTDGVTEAVNSEGAQYSVQRLIAAVKKEPMDSAQKKIQALSEEVEYFTGSVPQHDDITLLLLHI